MAGKRRNQGSKKRNPAVSFLLTLGIIICLGVMSYASYQLVSTALAYKAGRDEYDSLREYTSEVVMESSQAEEEETEEPEEPAASSSESEEEPAPAPGGPLTSTGTYAKLQAPINVDFESLKKINEEIVGWLYIPSIDISYPIVLGSDDDYYLHRTFERKDNFAGSIFMEAKNKGDFLDPNTIIYGHNMNDGSMFGRLSRLTSEEKYKKDPYIWILTPEQNYKYEMFSVHVTSVESSVYTLFQGTDNRFITWAVDMQSQSKADLKKQKFALDSRIITLSTCTGDSSTRYVVQALRVRGETPPVILAKRTAEEAAEAARRAAEEAENPDGSEDVWAQPGEEVYQEEYQEYTEDTW